MTRLVKRFMAVLLLVGMLTAMFVPATFAESESGTAAETVVYDFQLYKNAAFGEAATAFAHDAAGNVSANFDANGKYDGSARVYTWFYNNYATNTNWGIETSGGQNASVKDYYFRGATNQGVRLLTGDSGYVSLRIHVPATGAYNLELETGSTASAADIYLFPATTEYGAKTLTTADAITQAMADPANLLKSDVSLGINKKVSLGRKTFDATGDYILVFKADGSYSDGVVVRTLTMSPVLPDVVYNYDFRIYQNQDFASGFTYTSVTNNFEGHRTYNGTITIAKWFQNNYPATINWGMEVTKGVNNSAKDFWFRGKNDQGVRLRTPQADQYAAIRIYVGEPETYNVSLLAGTNTGVVDAYIFKATNAYAGYSANSAEMVDTAIANADNLLAANVSLATNAVSQLGQWTCPEAGDYIVVFKTVSSKDAEGYDIKMLTLATGTEEAPTEPSTSAPAATTQPETQGSTTQPEEPTVPDPDPGVPGVYTYDFKLGSNNDYLSYIKEKLGVTDVPAHNLYKAEASGTTMIPYKWFNSAFGKTINWGVEGVDSEQSGKMGADYYVETVNKNGLRVSLGKTDDGKAGWAAFRIIVDTAGIYQMDLSMLAGNDSNHIETGDILDFYVFEKFEKYSPHADNTAQIGPYLSEETYAGSLVYDSAKTAYTIRGGITFDAAGEYIFVIRERAEDTCRYIHLDTLTLTPSDTPDEPTVPELPEEPEEFIPEQDKDSDFTFDVVTNYPQLCGGLHVRPLLNPAKDNSGATILDENGKAMTTYDYLMSLYEKGYIDWALMGCYAQNGQGVDNVESRSGTGMRIYGQAGDWSAFMLNVPAGGEYNLKITGTGTNSVNIYLAEYTEELTPEQAMRQENLLIANLKSATNVAVKEKVAIKEGYYVLIVEHAVAANSSKDYWALTRFQLETWKEKEAKPVTDKVVLDFDLGAIDARFLKKRIENRLETGGISAKAQVANWYAEGKFNWTYEGHGKGMMDEKGNTDMTFRENAYRIRTKTGNYKSINDSYFAFRMKNPGTDTFDVRVISDGASMVCMNVYIAPVKNTLVLNAEGIKALMTSENLLVSNAMINKAGTYYLGEYTFGMEDEYLLVFELTKGTAFFLSQVELTKDGLVADGSVQYGSSYKGIVYDLDLNDAMNGIYSESKINVPDVLDDMNNRWNSGSLNWKWLNGSDGMSGDTPATEYLPTTNLRFYRGTGLRVYSGPDAWFAIKIKSPGSGDFTITLNHAVTANSGTIAMYVLPADTDIDKIWDATDPENRVGKVYLGNEDGDSAIVDGSTSFVGYWNFEAGKEYILVIEGYEKSRFNSRYCYMNLSQIIMEKGIVSYEAAEEEKRVEPITVLENAVPVMDLGSYGACAEINGHDYIFLPVEGGYMPVYDLDTYTLVDNVKTDIAYTRNVGVTPDNKIILANSTKYLGIYDPYTKEFEMSPNISNTPGLENVGVLDGITIDENGTIWLGSHYGAYLFTYNIETREFKSYGQPVGNQTNFRGMMCKDGYLYGAASGATESVVFKMDCATGEVVAKQDILHLMGTGEYIYSVNLIDEFVILGGSYLAGPIVLTQDTLEFTEIPGLVNHPNLNVSEEINGKHYMVLQGYGLYEYDKATKTVSKTPGFGTAGVGFRTGGLQSYGNTLITIDGDPCLVTYSGGQPKHFNLNTQEYFSYEGLMKPEHGRGGAKVRGFVSWPEGTNQFSFGAFNTTLCTVFNTETGKVDYYYNTGGQTDTQIWYQGKLYAGNYSSTTLNEIYPDPNNLTNEVIQRWRLDHEETGQKRVHCLAAGDGYVFAGTTPDTNLSGGGITVYDTTTGRWKFYRNPVENGSIMSLAYHDELVYATTTCNGGSGSGWADGLSAVVFAFDYMTGEAIAVLDPRDYIKDLASPVYHVRCVIPDPNIEENGRIWSMVSETLFCFTFDKETKKFDVQEVISFDKTAYSDNSTNNWFPKTILFDMERGYIYASFQSIGGMQRIELADWNAEIGAIKVKSSTRIMSDIPESNFMVMGEDGNLYYGVDTDIKMLPLNVTDEDWNIASAVDEQILGIGDEITVESEADIRTARSAYENLSWYYKALIQELETLQEAESDVLERKIDTIVLDTITAESFPAMTELLEEYQGLNARQQRYVKNYAALKEAYDKASDLNDRKIAAAMQERIDALEELFPLTLEDEPVVVKIREDYKVLTGKQAMLLDITLLEDAEAQIAVLRAELVVEVEKLIQAIPEEITLEAEPAIMAAREGVDKLYTNERKNISYSKLTAAEGKLRTLKNAKEKADPVVAMIDAIGTVWWNDAQAIAEARAAYEALNGTERTFVTNYDVLVAAEERLALVQTWGVPVIAGGSVIILLAAALVIFRKKIFKGKKKENA